VSGEGETEGRFPEEETRGREETWVEGVAPTCWAWTLSLRLMLLALRFVSGKLASGWEVGDLAEEGFDPPGERARLEVSLIQLRRAARWFMKGGWYFRRPLGTKPLGLRRSGFVDTTWSMLA
jgi:hypothetical protein